MSLRSFSAFVAVVMIIAIFQNCSGFTQMPFGYSSDASSSAPQAIAPTSQTLPVAIATPASTPPLGSTVPVAALMCPQGYTFAGGVCVPPTEGLANGTIFGIMYSTWHCPYADANTYGNPIYDVMSALAGTEAFGAYGTWGWKSAPPDGHYCLSQRDDVLRKHAIELRDAGIKFVYIDASNHPSSDPAYADRPDVMIETPFLAILRVWSLIPGAPRVVPFVAVTSIASPMINWMMAKLALYPQMQLIKDGKPFFLLAANPSLPIDQAQLTVLSQTYSYRKMWQNAVAGFTSDSWSFMSWCSNMSIFKALSGNAVCGQYITQNNGPEQIAVSPAYNSYIFSVPAQATARFGGATFARQFETVFNNPTAKYATFSDWNSWLAIHFCLTPAGAVVTDPTQCTPGTHEFVDTYTDELSRDIEPSVSRGDFDYRLMKSCISKFQRGIHCDATSALEATTITFGSALTDAATRACSYPAETNIPNPQSGQVYGNVDGISIVNNRAMLNGWVCIVGQNQPTSFQVFMGGPSGQGGAFIGQYTANLASETAVQQVCQNSVTNRFSVDITGFMNSNPGAHLYVHGLNPATMLNYYVLGSGHCTIPWPETTNGI